MSVKAILSTIPYKIKKDAEADLWRSYMAKCSRIITENTARMVREGSYVPTDYIDIIHPPKIDNRTSEEIIGDIVDKVKKIENAT